jgi:2,4-dienoyl-CoA reductase-like NADH-dependent reductase (Old Yellow Enzyme family)
VLFSPVKIRGTEIKNRLWISPMCQYSADDGFVNDWHMQWLGSLAVGGHGPRISNAPKGSGSVRDRAVADGPKGES